MIHFLAFFIKNSKLSFVISVFIVASGLMGLQQVKRESRPPVDFARATITTIYPGSSPEEVEEKVTIKIEDQLRSVEGIRDVQSISQAGRSSINIRVDMDNVDVNFVMDEIQRAVQRVTGLPQDIRDPPLFTRLNAKEIPILELALIGSNQGRARDQLAFNLKNMLEDERSVAAARLTGYREREFQILLDPARMERFHVGISEVEQAVRRRTQNIPAGFIRSPEDQRLVRVTGQIRSAEEMADIVIRSNFSGQRIYVRNVASVRDDMEDPSTLVRVNGQPATLMVVTKKADADAVSAVANLKQRVEEFKELYLPEGYDIITYNNEATRIETQLGIVVTNALVGLVLVLLILLIFLPGIMGVLTALSLPLALLGALALMPSMGVNFNTITMLALVIAMGMLVDNAVVISENFARLRLKGFSRQEAAIKAVHQFWLPLSATVFTTMAAFLPMLVTKGVMGQFIMWIPIMVSIALFMSLFEAFILLPSRLQFTLRNLKRYRKWAQQEEGPGEGPGEPAPMVAGRTWFDSVRDGFEAFMLVAIRWRYMVFVLIGLLLGSSIYLSVKHNRFELFPAEEVEFYVARFEAPITTTVERTDELAGALSEQVLETLGRDKVRYVISRAGVSQAGLGDPNSKTGDYVGMLTIAIPIEVARELNVQDVLRQLRSIPRGDFERLSFSELRGGPPVGSAMQLTFRSIDYNQLRSMVDLFKERISEVEGVVDLEDDEIRGGPELRVEPNHALLASLNLDTQTVGAALRTALQGSIVSELNMDGDDFFLRLRLDDQERSSLNALRRAKIMEPSGKLIPLTSIVRISDTEGPTVRKHYNFRRAITVTSGVVPEELTSIQLNARAREIIGQMQSQFPTVSVSFGGEEESTRESISSLFSALILSVFGIFGILVFLFRSFLRPILILSTIPLGLVGVSWSFFFHGRPLSFFALIGVLGLAGVVINAAIVLVSYIDDLIKEDELPYQRLLARASADRLRAVIVTSLTTLGGLFPTAYGLGGHDIVLVPMTLALAWGLASGTILTLIWIPCGYAIVDDISRWSYKIFMALFGRFIPEDS